MNMHLSSIRKIISLLSACFLLVSVFVAHANERTEQVKGQYIIVLKSTEALNSKSTIYNQSVEQVANRLIEKARRNQLRFNSISTNRQGPGGLKANKTKAIYNHAIRGFSAVLTKEAVELLRNSPEVDYIEPDYVMTSDTIQSPTPSWGLDRIDQYDLPLDQAYEYVYDGSGVHVYVIDSGVRTTHSEFTNRIGQGWDFVSNDNLPNDCSGHGTHVAGTIGGTNHGVAKNTIIHPVRVMDCSGEGLTSRTISGIDWVIANAQSPAVINMSISGPANTAMDQAVSRAFDAGISIVVAASNGNGADACKRSPGRSNKTITVASSNNQDVRAASSNIGRCVDLFGPGVNIWSASQNSDTATELKSGTSMATPHVAGAVALLLDETPTLSAAQTKEKLLRNTLNYRISNPGVRTPNRLLFTRELPSAFTVHWDGYGGNDAQARNDAINGLQQEFPGVTVHGTSNCRTDTSVVDAYVRVCTANGYYSQDGSSSSGGSSSGGSSSGGSSSGGSSSGGSSSGGSSSGGSSSGGSSSGGSSSGGGTLVSANGYGISSAIATQNATNNLYSSYPGVVLDRVECDPFINPRTWTCTAIGYL